MRMASRCRRRCWRWRSEAARRASLQLGYLSLRPARDTRQVPELVDRTCVDVVEALAQHARERTARSQLDEDATSALVQRVQALRPFDRMRDLRGERRDCAVA